MSKIIRTINVMISNSKKINDVIVGKVDEKRYFFLYDKKYKWSISKDDFNNFFLHYYTDPAPIELIAIMDVDQWKKYDKFIAYSTKEIRAQEAFESMRDLYQLLKEILLGIDSAFDDIIESDESF